jgi:hypothetical protein
MPLISNKTVKSIPITVVRILQPQERKVSAPAYILHGCPDHIEFLTTHFDACSVYVAAMSHAKATCLLLASCLLLLQLTLPCVQATRLGPAAGFNRRSLLQQATDQQATAADTNTTNDIPMAPLAVLQLSLFAANLSNLAYPGTLLADNTDVENSYTNQTAFQK